MRQYTTGCHCENLKKKYILGTLRELMNIKIKVFKETYTEFMINAGDFWEECGSPVGG